MTSSFSPVDCPCLLLPPWEARKYTFSKLLTEAPKISQQLAMIDWRRREDLNHGDEKTTTSEILSFHSVHNQMHEWTGPNQDQDRQRPILMDRWSRSG